MPNYSWPDMQSRKVMGKRIQRADGPAKASGKAKYSSDLNPPNLLHAVFLTCPHAHAKVTSVDTSAAEKMKGVTAVRVVSGPGTEIQWAGTEVVAVAAEKESIARDAIRADQGQLRSAAARGSRGRPVKGRQPSQARRRTDHRRSRRCLQRIGCGRQPGQLCDSGDYPLLSRAAWQRDPVAG